MTAPGGIVGRDAEILRLRGAVRDLAAGRGGAVWIEGEPGIGKSALLSAGLSEAGALGCQVYRCEPDGLDQRFPLRVLLDALGVHAWSDDSARAGIAGLLRGEGTTGLAAPRDVVAAAGERLLELVERMCAAGPAVVVVDDLQWADAVSLSLWPSLRHIAAQAPLLLVAACRPVQAGTEIAGLRAAMQRTGADVIPLGPLGAGDVDTLLSTLLGVPPGPELLRRSALAGGNPLFLRELVDALVRERAVRIDDRGAEIAAGEPTPTSLSEAIAGRLGFLSPSVVPVMQVAAVLGMQCSVAELAAVTGYPDERLQAVLAEATTAGVLAWLTASGPQRVAFRHGLIRQALSAAMPAPLRSALHGEAAEALSRTGTGDPARIAEHLLEGPDVPGAWSVDWLAGAAASLVHSAPAVAVELLERVGRHGAGGRDRLDAWLATALLLQDRYHDVQALAGPLLERTADPEVAGRMAWASAYALQRMSRYEQALAVADRAIGDDRLAPRWRARVAAQRAVVLLSSAHVVEAEQAGAAAVLAARAASDPLAHGYALHALAMARSRHDRDAATLLAAIDEALEVVGHEPEAADLRLLLLGNRATALGNLSRYVEAERAIGDAVAEAERAGAPSRLAATRLQAAQLGFLAGRWDAAEAELAAAAELVRANPPRWLWLHGMGALLAVHRDDRAAFGQHLTECTDLETGAGEMRYYGLYLRVAEALAAERDGRLEAAFAGLHATLGLDDAAYLVEDSYLWLPDLARLALLLDRPEVARSAATAASAEARRAPTTAAEAASLHCGGLCTGDAEVIGAAADLYRSSGLPLYRAQALENAAVAHAGRGLVDAARTAYRQAVEVYTELDAAWDLLRADARLRPLGIRRGQRGERSRPATGWKALTPTELRVAHLMAAGRSNPDIAVELFLSRATVQTHVSHILRKLEARSRVDVAREAAGQQAAAVPQRQTPTDRVIRRAGTP